MFSFMSLTANRQPLEDFEGTARKAMAGRNSPIQIDLPLHLFQWHANASGQVGTEVPDIRSISQLETHDQDAVRVL